MKEEILKNLDKIDKNRYDELSILLDENKNTKEYFVNSYNTIMNNWKKEFVEFDIPNTMVGININGNSECYSNSSVLKKENIFDLASMSKLYTEMILFDVMEDYDITLESKISDLTSEYSDIGFLTIMDLLSFNNTYKTKIDTRECKNKKEALEALRTAYIIEEKKNYYLYTDLPIMILTDIMEMYTKLSYRELFEKYILKKYNLKNTYLEIDNELYLTVNKGMVNDPKANIMGGYYGHCGVRATVEDLLTFLNHVLESKYLYLFTTLGKTLDEDGNRKMTKGLIGNANLCVEDNSSMASIYLPSISFAIQGSIRCHSELAIFKVNGVDYKVVSCIFTDLYTQEENIKKYEINHDKKISKTIQLDDGKEYIMYDIRNIFSYDGEYKEVVDLVGKCRILDLYKYISRL